jgi:hypothetical protein
VLACWRVLRIRRVREIGRSGASTRLLQDGVTRSSGLDEEGQLLGDGETGGAGAGVAGGRAWASSGVRHDDGAGTGRCPGIDDD